jgi:predicted Ser/Thr protein kinase
VTPQEPPRSRQEERALLEAWLESALENGQGRLLGRGYQASVYLYSSPVGDIVVKRAHPSPLLRAIALRALRREASVYERLRDVPGTPKSYGLLHGHLVLEHVAGPSLRQYEDRIADRDVFFGRLRETLEAMHAAGVAHGDLKRKDNMLVASGELPYVIDFGIAWCVDADSPGWRRRVFDLVRQMDYNAWIKLKYRRRTDNLSPEDADRYRPLLLERVARAIRIPWQKVTLRRMRKRRRNRDS